MAVRLSARSRASALVLVYLLFRYLHLQVISPSILLFSPTYVLYFLSPSQQPVTTIALQVSPLPVAICLYSMFSFFLSRSIGFQSFFSDCNGAKPLSLITTAFNELDIQKVVTNVSMQGPQ